MNTRFDVAGQRLRADVVGMDGVDVKPLTAGHSRDRCQVGVHDVATGDAGAGGRIEQLVEAEAGSDRHHPKPRRTLGEGSEELLFLGIVEQPAPERDVPDIVETRGGDEGAGIVLAGA